MSKIRGAFHTDITYVKVPGGYCYTVSIMDAYSKKILSMNYSNTLDRRFCVEAAEEAVRKYGYPEIIHSDRGKQFLSRDFFRVFKDKDGNEISKLSFGKKGFKDNIYIESMSVSIYGRLALSRMLRRSAGNGLSITTGKGFTKHSVIERLMRFTTDTKGRY